MATNVFKRFFDFFDFLENFCGESVFFRGTLSFEQHIREAKSYRGGFIAPFNLAPQSKIFYFDVNSEYPDRMARNLLPVECQQAEVSSLDILKRI